MPSSDLTTYQGLVSLIFDRRYYRRAEDGVIVAIDGDRCDIRLLASSNIIRYVEVIGDIATLQVGQEVALRWRDNRPQVMCAETAAVSATSGGGGGWPIDNQTLELSIYGLRVKTHGIGLEHLNFEPAMKDHTHRDDPFTVGGWQITNSGVIWKHNTRIYPSGQIALGLEDNVIKLDSQHDIYRMWVGATQPENADFSLSKLGEVFAYAGEIAGWTISATKLSKNNLELDPQGKIKVGTGNDVAYLSSVDSIWREWIGHETPASAPFRVNKLGDVWAESATITGSIKSSNYVAGISGFYLDAGGHLEAEDVKIRGRIDTTVFTKSQISTISGQMLVSLGVVLIADVEDTDTSIDVDVNVFSTGDIIHLKPHPNRSEYMMITSMGQGITGGYRYTVERNLDESGADDFYTGEVAVRKGSAAVTRDIFPLASGDEGGEFGDYQPGGSGGSSGGGWLVLDGESPFFGVNARLGPVWNQFTRVVQIGNLVGCPLEEYQTETWGLFIGDDATYMTYDQDNGLRIRAIGNDADSEIDKTGIATDYFALKKVAAAPSYVDARGRFFFVNDGGTLKTKVRMKDGATETEITLAHNDHGSLEGLSDDDHEQYILADGSRNVTGAMIFESGLTINEDGDDADTRIESNNLDDAFFINAGDDNVIVGGQSIHLGNDIAFGIQSRTEGGWSKSQSVAFMELGDVEGGSDGIQFGHLHYVDGSYDAKFMILANGIYYDPDDDSWHDIDNTRYGIYYAQTSRAVAGTTVGHFFYITGGVDSVVLHDYFHICTTEIAFNQNSLDVDFRIKTNTLANAFVIDAGDSTLSLDIRAIFKEQTRPSAPSSGYGTVYPKDGGDLYYQNDAGREMPLSHLRVIHDDFWGDSLDTRWADESTGTGYLTLQANSPSRVTIATGATAGGIGFLSEGAYYHWDPTETISMIARFRVTDLASTYTGIAFDIGLFSVDNDNRVWIRHGDAAYLRLYTWDDGLATNVLLGTIAADTWYTVYMTLTSSYVRGQLGDGTIQEITDYLPDEDLRMKMISYNATHNVDMALEIDYITLLPGVAIL